GELVWVRDNDDMLYLAVGSQAYHNHPWRLSDPAKAEGGLPLYSWLPCVPGVLLAKALGLGPVGIGTAWRILAGVSIPLAWYLLVRRAIGPAWVAAVVTLILTADIGSMSGMLVAWQAQLLELLRFRANPWLMTPYRPSTQWRVVTPG